MPALTSRPVIIPVARDTQLLRWPSGFLEISMRPDLRLFYLRRDGSGCITIPFDQISAVNLVLHQMALHRPVRDTHISKG